MTTQRGAYGRFIASRSEPGMGCVRGNASTAAPEARGRPKMGGCGSGTIAGAAAIDPRHLALRTPAPPVWLEGLMFDNRPVPVSSGARPPGDPVHGAELRGGLAHPVPLSPGRFRQGMDRSRRPPAGLL